MSTESAHLTSDWTRARQEFAVLEQLKANSDIDYVFKAWALSVISPATSLEFLDEAAQRSRLPLIRVIRGQVRASAAWTDSNPRLADKAILDIVAAKEYLQDNLMVASTSLFVNTIAAELYREANETDKEAVARKVASDDAIDLENWMPLPDAASSLWWYYGDVGNESAQLSVAQRAAEHSNLNSVDVMFAILLCRRGQFEDAVRILDERKSHDIDGDKLRAYVLAELHPNDIEIARAYNEEIRARYDPRLTTDTKDSELESYRRMLCVLGQNDVAVEKYRIALAQVGPSLDVASRRVFQFGSGIVSEGDVLAFGGDRSYRTDINYQVGVFRLGAGDREGAKKCFEQVSVLRDGGFDVELVRTFLLRLNRDPSWPPWIPMTQ